MNNDQIKQDQLNFYKLFQLYQLNFHIQKVDLQVYQPKKKINLKTKKKKKTYFWNNIRSK